MDFRGPVSRGWSLARGGLHRPQLRCSSSSSPATDQAPQPKKGGSLLGAALISGGMGVAGDVLAQCLVRRPWDKASLACLGSALSRQAGWMC